MQFKSFKLDTTYTYPPTVTTVYIKSRNYISLYTIWKAPLISLRMWQHVFFCFCGIRCINTHAPTHHSLHWAAAQLPSFIPRCNGQKHHIDSELKVASSSRRWHVFFHPVDGFNLNILSTIVFGWLWMSLDDFGWSKMLSISFGMAWNHQTVFFLCWKFPEGRHWSNLALLLQLPQAFGSKPPHVDSDVSISAGCFTHVATPVNWPEKL